MWKSSCLAFPPDRRRNKSRNKLKIKKTERLIGASAEGTRGTKCLFLPSLSFNCMKMIKNWLTKWKHERIVVETVKTWHPFYTRSLKPSLFWRFQAAQTFLQSFKVVWINRSPEVLKGCHSFLCGLSVWRWWGNGEETEEAKSARRKQLNEIRESCQEAKKTWTKSWELLHPSSDLLQIH